MCFMICDIQQVNMLCKQMHEIVVLIAYASSQSSNILAQLSSGSRDLTFGLSVNLFTDFVCTTRIGSDETECIHLHV